MPSYIVEHQSELLPFLFTALPEVKRNKIRQWLKFDSIRVNGQVANRTNHVLNIGDTVSIETQTSSAASQSFPAKLKIVYEDPSLIVIDKPANLLSMGTDTEREKTAYAYLTDYVRRGNPRSQERIWIVHRLDYETSGLMVFARTEAVKQALQANWEQVEKRYVALVEGEPAEDQGTWTSYLDETGPYKIFSAPPSDKTRLAITHFKVLKRSPYCSLVELDLATGRRNQIRVHLAEAHCPIIGDKKYGSQTNPARRIALHAGFLQFQHPASRELVTFESPLPPELARLL